MKHRLMINAMIPLLLLLSLVTFSLSSAEPETTEQSEVSTPLQMSRLKKKGGRVEGGQCTDESLRRVMNESMGEEMTETKRAVHRAVSRIFDGSFGVICAESAFSYIVHTHEFCVHSKDDITCLVYKDG
ncbi:unnamed protein product [Nippostrongylus brasiliensis]|uniref:Ground-like domain-containing protein n=1 Tax=Nippostrongylus brasiliensis TaxID=27835 RepID=A0A0N4Y3D6_NIPBR|nr:unnamed protein product [Nippostrongylus brasiliensis]